MKKTEQKILKMYSTVSNDISFPVCVYVWTRVIPSHFQISIRKIAQRGVPCFVAVHFGTHHKKISYNNDHGKRRRITQWGLCTIMREIKHCLNARCGESGCKDWGRKAHFPFSKKGHHFHQHWHHHKGKREKRKNQVRWGWVVWHVVAADIECRLLYV